MGGFFMLLRLIIFRLGPLISLHFCKDRKQIKVNFAVMGIIYVLCFLIAAWRIFGQKKWMGIIYLPISMFPHYLCYGFAIWLLIRCLWSAWSARVWKRIYGIAIICVIFGILAENYWNPQILQFFFEIFK